MSRRCRAVTETYERPFDRLDVERIFPEMVWGSDKQIFSEPLANLSVSLSLSLSLQQVISLFSFQVNLVELICLWTLSILHCRKIKCLTNVLHAWKFIWLLKCWIMLRVTLAAGKNWIMHHRVNTRICPVMGINARCENSDVWKWRFCVNSAVPLRFRAAVTGSAGRRTEGNLAKPDKRPPFISR